MADDLNLLATVVEGEGAAAEAPAAEAAAWGSDVLADLLRRFDLPYLAINPGASFRGLHDSIVNRLGNAAPELVLTLHEAQAVAIAHGYAKVAGEPMGVVLHANVGLMNAVMAIYNAWCDRVPMLVLGATGAVDAARRRPWIEWIHTSRDQGALVRSFVKWDDQPASVPAAVEALLRAWQITRTAPRAPVYVCLDAGLQEDPLEAPVHLPPDLARFAPPRDPEPDEASLLAALDLLAASRRPVLLVGRHARTEAGFADRIRLAETVGAAVICDQKVGVGFPSRHPLYVGAPAQYPAANVRAALAEADVVVGLDWPDLAGALALTRGAPRVVHASPDAELHNGWSFDHQAFAPADVRVRTTPERFVAALLRGLDEATLTPAGRRRELPEALRPPAPRALPRTGPITLDHLAGALERARGERDLTYVRLPLGWPDHLTSFRSPLDCLGLDGGGGIGSGPGLAVGAALALKGSGRLPVAVIGDGDFAMGVQALWTAANRRLPLVVVVANNRSFYNDVEHQERVARARGRPVENRFVGMSLDDPPLDILGLAAASGAGALGPVREPAGLEGALAEALRRAEAGGFVVVDVAIDPEPGREKPLRSRVRRDDRGNGRRRAAKGEQGHETT